MGNIKRPGPSPGATAAQQLAQAARGRELISQQLLDRIADGTVSQLDLTQAKKAAGEAAANAIGARPMTLSLPPSDLLKRGIDPNTEEFKQAEAKQKQRYADAHLALDLAAAVDKQLGQQPALTTAQESYKDDPTIRNYIRLHTAELQTSRSKGED